MINQVTGRVIGRDEKQLTVLVSSLGLGITVPRIEQYTVDQEVTLYTYMHWNQEKGPSLLGFTEQIARDIFLLLIQVPKIGPGSAIGILNQSDPEEIIGSITAQDVTALSRFKGVGKKTAESIIHALKDKVGELISHGKLAVSNNSNAMHWQHVQDALAGLNYSSQEIQEALGYLTEKYKNEQVELNLLLRAALQYLSQAR